MITDFKKGDLVRVIESPELKRWSRWKNALGYEFKIKYVTKRFNEGRESNCSICPTNKFGINYMNCCIELVSKEPTYEVY